MKKLLLILMAGCLILSSCQKAPSTTTSGVSQAVIPNSSGNAPAESITQSAPDIKMLGIEDAPVKDLTDLDSVTQVYVRPIDVMDKRGIMWLHSWAMPSDMGADILINILSFNNFLNLPLDFEGCYVQPEVPAARVEPFIQKHFDVTSEYLKTSELYNTQKDSYTLLGGTGPYGACALSAKQEGNKIIIRTGIERDVWKENSDTGNTENQYRKLIPTGTLTVELDDENVVHYLSFQKEDGFNEEVLNS